MIGVAQLSGQNSNTAKGLDRSLMFHASHVHTSCTVVNVDCVTTCADNARMSEVQTTGQTLRHLMERAGLSVRGFAVAAGYSHGSGVQRYIEPDFEGLIKPDVAKRMADALSGKGTPPIDAHEVYALVGLPMPNGVPIQFEGASFERMRPDLPILGTALGADRVSDGQAVEQTFLYEDEVIGHAKRPVILDGRADAYGLYVRGASMDPVYEDGALILVETKRPPRIGDNVIVYLRKNGEFHEADDGQSARTVLVKRLAKRTASIVELAQYNPKLTFTVSAKDVLKMHRVIPWQELIS